MDRSHDIFLSHNSLDKQQVEILAHQLLDKGVCPWFDKWELRPGQPWLSTIETAIKTCQTVVVCLGNDGQGRVQAPEIETALIESLDDRGKSVIPVILPHVPLTTDPSSLTPTWLKRLTWVDLRRDYLAGLANLVAEILRQSPPILVRKKSGSPYLGLKSFMEKDAPNFFGRSEDVVDLLARLREANSLGSRLLTLVGASGSGKSSLVLAGLIPAVRSGQLDGSYDWQVAVVRPGVRPCHSLSVRLTQFANGDAASLSRTTQQLLDQQTTLNDTFDLLVSADDGNCKVLLVIDQLEELFTVTEVAGDRCSFIQNLLFAANHSNGRVHVVMTMRADFLGKALEAAALGKAVKQSTILVTPMNRDGLSDAIRRPALRSGVAIEQAVVDSLVDGVQAEPGHLPLLEFALERLWIAKDEHNITWSTYTLIGTLTGAITKHADLVCKALDNEGKLKTTRKVLTGLVQPGAGNEHTRLRRPRNEIVRIAPDAADVLERLIDERLVTANENDVEIAHEALIRNWKQLPIWVEQERDRKQRIRRNTINSLIAMMVFLVIGTASASIWRYDTALRKATEYARRSKERSHIASLQSRADSFWPVESSHVAGIEQWLKEASRVADRLPKYERELDSMAQKPDSSKTRSDIEQEELLISLVAQICELAVDEGNTVSSMTGRLTFAKSVRQETIDRYANEWKEIIEAIKKQLAIDIRPQVGLIPLDSWKQTGIFEFLDWQTHASGETAIDNIVSSGHGIVFVLLPGGTFTMGASSEVDQPNYDKDASPNEGEPHDVALAPFFMSKYELTQDQWNRFTGGNPASHQLKDDATTDAHPIESISWLESKTQLERMGIDFPTEAQWEYACRAGTTQAYWSGDSTEDLRVVGWYEGNAQQSPHPVGEKLPNPFGLFDVHGNVWEWCRDAYTAYTVRPQEPDGLRVDDKSKFVVVRGGSFVDTAGFARSATRWYFTPNYKSHFIGIRPIRVVAP